MFGQKNLNISGGVGFPETINIGIRYQIPDQSQIGLSIGTWPSPGGWLFNWKSLVSLTGDFYYHLGDSSKFSEMPPWYIRIGLNYLRIAYESGLENNLESHLRFGRDFYFSEDSGVSLDAGVGAFLKNETGFTKVLPALGLSFFYRF